MKALSLWQPWASGIALGVKAIETRHWATTYRGPLAVHASKRWNGDQREFAEAERREGTIGFGLPFGAIVAVVDLIDIKRSELLEDAISAVEGRWGNYAPNRFGWLLGNVRPLLVPVPCVGRQSLWTLDEQTAALVWSRVNG
jgi:activating signal cointegrator 1